MTAPETLCPHCRRMVSPFLAWNGPHIEAMCPVCPGAKHLKFVPQTEPWLSLAGPRPADRPTEITQRRLFGDVT